MHPKAQSRRLWGRKGTGRREDRHARRHAWHLALATQCTRGTPVVCRSQGTTTSTLRPLVRPLEHASIPEWAPRPKSRRMGVTSWQRADGATLPSSQARPKAARCADACSMLQGYCSGMQSWESKSGVAGIGGGGEGSCAHGVRGLVRWCGTWHDGAWEVGDRGGVQGGS